jgi:hypothetical protein
VALINARETRGNSKKRLSSWETRHESCSRNRWSGIYFWHLASFVTADYRHTRFTQLHHDRLPFRFTGRIDKLTYKIGPEQLSEEDHKTMEEQNAKAKD